MTRIDRLLLLAGPSTAGKSTLIKRLQAKERVEQLARVGVGDLSTWTVSEPHGRKDVVADGVKELLYHFDIFAAWKAVVLNRTNWANPLLERVESADDVTCLTLWVQPDILAARMEERRASASRKRRERMDRRGGYRVLMDLYQDPVAVIAEYDAWFELAAPLGFSHHWIVDNNLPQIQVFPLEHWQNIKRTTLESRLPG